MGLQTVETVSRRSPVYYRNGHWHALMDNDHDRWDRNAFEMVLTTIEDWLRGFPPVRHKNQAADSLLRRPTNEENNSPLHDDVLALIITETEPGLGKTQEEAKNWRSLHCNNWIETVQSTGLEVFQVSDRRDKERARTTRKFVTEQARDPWCTKVANTAGSLESVYS